LILLSLLVADWKERFAKEVENDSARWFHRGINGYFRGFPNGRPWRFGSPRRYFLETTISYRCTTRLGGLSFEGERIAGVNQYEDY
jgi:hypothetical protein